MDNDTVKPADAVGSSEGLGLAPERAFKAWAFEQPDFSTMHPWDVARSAYFAAVTAEREQFKPLLRRVLTQAMRSGDRVEDPEAIELARKFLVA